MKSEISALVDNELAPESIDRTLDEMKRNAELYASWTGDHVIGDVLLCAPAVSPDFSGAHHGAPVTEPVVLAPAAMADLPQSRIRIALPLAAAAMVMAAVAWVALSLNPPESGSLAAAKPAKPGATGCGADSGASPRRDQRVSRGTPGLLVRQPDSRRGARHTDRFRDQAGRSSMRLVPFLITVGGLLTTPAYADPGDAVSWLQRIAVAAQNLNFTGTFSYQTAAGAETSRITHLFDASGEHERIEALVLSLRELVRSNDEIKCYLPDDKLIIVENRRQ